MSGQTVGAVIGVGISILSGGAIPPNVGWLIGSVVGGAMFPNRTGGPRLNDLKVQASEYGRPIPIVYSITAVAGNVIWASDIVERECSSGGGKGGGESTTYSYFANFAVAICEGEISLGRVWAGPEKRLIYDPAGTGTLEGGGTVTFYGGTQTQNPDPLMESFEGVGAVPAYRGVAYVVFQEFPLANDGNRIPFLTIEVGKAGNVAPESLGMVWWSKITVTSDYILVPYWGSYRGVVARSLADYSFVANRPIAFPESSTSDFIVWDEDRGVSLRMSPNTQTYRRTVLLTGVESDHTLAGLAGTDYVRGVVYQNGSYIFGAYAAATGHTKIIVVDAATNAVSTMYSYTEGGGEQFSGPLLALPGAPNAVIGATPTRIRRYDMDGSTVSVDLGARALDGTGAAGAVDIDQATGIVWSVAKSDSVATLYVNATHPSAGLLLASAVPTLIWHLAYDPLVFVPGDGVSRPNRMYVVGERGGTWTDYYEEFDADAGGYIAGHEGTYHGTNELGGVFYNPATERLVGLRNRSGHYAVSTTLDPTTIPFTTGYMGGADSSLATQTLAEVVADLSSRAGLTPSDYDVSQLTDTVDGYTVGQQTTVRDAIAALAPVYYFDAVESQGVVKFVKRGGSVAAVIAEEDLGAHAAGGEAPDGLTTVRAMEDELPRTLNVNYTLAATDYSPASRYARRLVGSTGSEETMELPLVLSDTKAQEVAEVNLHTAWVGRLGYQFALPRKYSYLEPTDIVVVSGYAMRLTRCVQSGGVLKCDAVADDANVYTPSVVVTETTAREQAVSVPSLTTMELL